MAAVLRYGYEPAQARSMQSFIRPRMFDYMSHCDHKAYSCTVPGSCDRPSDHRNTTQRHGLDGAADQTTPIPTHQISADNEIAAHNSTSAFTDSPRQPSLKESQTCEAQKQDDADIDPNSDRRKRRKLTPKTNQQTLGDTILKLNNKDLKSKTASENQTSHDGADTTSLTILDGLSDPNKASTNSISTKDSGLKTPKKRTPRKKHSLHTTDLAPGVASINKSEVEEGLQLTPSKSKRTSPRNKKRKTISLHTNGKLVSSPTSSSPPADKKHPKTDARPTAIRNFKMKNGKFIQTLHVRVKYGQNDEARREMGNKIDTILSTSAIQAHLQKDSSKTHPFFLGKLKPKLSADDKTSINGDHQEDGGDSALPRKELVAWKDIKFASKKPSTFMLSETLLPPWPPLLIQHVGYTPASRIPDAASYRALDYAKQKTKLLNFSEDEDVLRIFQNTLSNLTSVTQEVRQPEKRLLTGTEVAENVTTACIEEHTHPAIESVKSRIASGSTPFDRGECSGPNLWPQHYAPRRWSEVLQPSASLLHNWLQSLAIHNVQSGVDTTGRKQKVKLQNKKKRRKPKGEFDDFIIGSDNEDAELGRSAKTAILIAGPNGCGKTASVFAVAKELGFEVFEIHPGMRRSAKDIFDKVGDMAHNHLVQKGTDLSRSSSVTPSETGLVTDPEIDTSQTSVANFLGSKPNSKSSTKEDVAPVRAKREQKQSLILFEEVDLLFDDDKGFWAGVQSLIAHSKRPVVLTCNNIDCVPVDELDLHDILTYTSVSSNLATDYLMHIAAAEGHILDRMALSTLYASKGQDLRASITELNFWCQMTVGSQYGGLDWMGHNQTGGMNAEQCKSTRTFSQDTFHEALDLLPHNSADESAAVKFNHDELGLPALEWCDFTDTSQTLMREHHAKNVTVLEKLSRIAEARSAADAFSGEALYSMAGAIATVSPSGTSITDRHVVSQRYIQQHNDRLEPQLNIAAAFEPITIERPTFPPSQGRLAPSLDSRFSSSIATDVGPYVRAIVNFDQHTERHRDEIFGSQGKQRTTRAARAAAEGGDKSKTRSERWFPKDLDFNRVLRTASNWPQWYGKGHVDIIDTDTEGGLKTSETRVDTVAD